MNRNDDDYRPLPPRVKAAFEFLHHARMVTEQVDAAIPMRPLSALERSVESAALRAIQQYLLGEMEFAEESPAPATRDEDESSGDEAPLRP